MNRELVGTRSPRREAGVMGWKLASGELSLLGRQRKKNANKRVRLLIPQRLYRLQFRRLIRREYAEEHTHANGEEECKDDR